MLEPFIIEEIRRREQERQDQEHRLPLELPIFEPPMEEASPPPVDVDRGVTIIEF